MEKKVVKKKNIVNSQAKDSSGDDAGCRCDEINKKCMQMEENWKRSVADFANFKKRAEEEKKFIMNIAKAEVVLSFLPIYDSLCRAIESKDTDPAGVEKIIQQFEGVIKNYGIEKIQIDKIFDPKWCEAIGFVEGDKENDGQVAQVVENGFKAGEEVIKPVKALLYKSK